MVNAGSAVLALIALIPRKKQCQRASQQAVLPKVAAWVRRMVQLAVVKQTTQKQTVAHQTETKHD